MNAKSFHITIKIVLSLVMVVLFTGISLAQRTNSIGFRGGMNLAKAGGKNISDTRHRVAPNLGVFITHSVREHWGLTAEINYSGKGFHRTTDHSTVRLHYIEVPVYGTFYFYGTDAKVRPKVFLGPSVGGLVKSSEKGRYNPFEISVVGGAGLNYEIAGDRWIYFDVRYQRGLSSLYRRGELPLPVVQFGNGVNNRALSFNLGMSFPLD